MTIREAFSEIQGICGNYAPENTYMAAARHLKHATMDFARTPALIQAVTITPNGVADYALPFTRIGRVYMIQHQVDQRTYVPNLVELGQIAEQYPDPTTTGTEVRYVSIFGSTLRAAPLVSGGTLTLYFSPMPVPKLRDTPRNKNETATGGSTSSIVASTITHGLVNNRGGATDYFNGCRVVFTSPGLETQASFITGANEGASSITFTMSPVVSTAVTVTTFQIEDVLEVAEQYVPACVNYAAGMIAALDKSAAVLSGRLLQQYDDVLAEARGKPFGWQPGAKFRVADYMERSGNRVWVS